MNCLLPVQKISLRDKLANQKDNVVSTESESDETLYISFWHLHNIQAFSSVFYKSIGLRMIENQNETKQNKKSQKTDFC